MNSIGLTVKASILVSMMFNTQAWAQQGLPDEINYKHYLQIYQGLDQILQQKSAEFEKLSSQKTQLEQSISRMERDLAQLPDRNSELRGMIAYKRQEVQSLNAELRRLEVTLERLENDIRSTERVMNSLQQDIRREEGQKNHIESRYRLQHQLVARVNSRLQNEIRQENQTAQGLNKLAMELKKNQQEKAQKEQERQRLPREIERNQRELSQEKSKLEQNNSVLAAKRPLLNQVQAKLPQIKNEMASLRSQLAGDETALKQKGSELVRLLREPGAHQARIAALQSEIRQIEGEIREKKRQMDILQREESLINSQVAALNADIRKLETEINQLTRKISEMERSISNLPNELRQIEAQIKKYDEVINRLTAEISREERQLVNIRQGRQRIENEFRREETKLGMISQELGNSDRILLDLNQRHREVTQRRNYLVQDHTNVRSDYDSLFDRRDSAERDAVSFQNEIVTNDQRLTQASRELPGLRQNLAVISPKVSVAARERNLAEVKANEANSAYHARLDLYQGYLTSAHKLGEEKALIGKSDGSSAGEKEATALGIKLASESAQQEAKWEALRRGYVRGEISGYETGYNLGYATASEVERGEVEGELAGSKRARNYADHVIKPQMYQAEFNRRLVEDETVSKSKLFKTFSELSSVKSVMNFKQETIPDLSESEILQSLEIVSSLDPLIEQSKGELQKILSLRTKISDAQNVYPKPGPGVNANTVNCSAVYKGVKDFVEACKGSYVIQYESLYQTAHQSAFNAKYGSIFKAQVPKTYSQELQRLYPGYLSEGSRVGKEVGIAMGKRDIYQETFTRSEENSYALNLPFEEARVEQESRKLVQDHLEKNAALTVKEKVKLVTDSPFGIAPGTEVMLQMRVKNIGSQASQGSGLVKITSASADLLLDRKEAPLANVPARTTVKQDVLKLRVSDQVLPGTRIILSGEITHPGNHYSSERVEKFTIEQEIAINPAINFDVKYEKTPRVAVRMIGKIKVHAVEVNLQPLFAGVDQGYEISMEEVGSDYSEIIGGPVVTEVLKTGTNKKVFLNYKLSKKAQGKSILFKLTLKNRGLVVGTQELAVKAI